MPRHISRERDRLGSSKKVSPKVENSSTQKAIDEIYKELNRIELSVSKEPIASESSPLEGKAGDIRLYTKTAQDGSHGYFIQGKFGDSWASGRLGLQLIDPELPENSVTSVKSYVDDGGEYITKLGVTYENLAYNNDVGEGSDQVARGNHGHALYDNHIADTTIHFTLADIPTTATVKNTASQGIATTAARSDHVHKLDTSEAYTWTNKQTITVNSGDALDITGDVSITGDLTVDYAATGDGNGNANIEGNVVLNQVDSGQDYSDTYTTRINGKLTAYNETVIQHNDNQLSLRYGADNTKKFDINVNANALTTFTVSNNESIIFNASSLRPSQNLVTDLGHSTKKWRSIHAGELIVENLVAQDVMATIGGRIMVAPTTKLFSQLGPATVGEFPPPHQDTMDVVDNIFAVNDIAFLQTAPGGVAQMEAVQITQYNGQTPTGGHRYTILRDIDESGPAVGHTWEIDDAIVNLGYNEGEGFIDITSTQGIYSSSGPHIAMHSRSSNNSDWQVPEVLRIGNLNGTWYTSNDKYGVLLGENLDNQPSDNTNPPFKGLLGTKDGVELYNTPIKLYDGGNLIGYMGQDQRTGVTGAQFALGDNLTFSNNTTSGAKLKFEKDATSGSYELTIDQGSINVTVDADDITTAMPWLDDTPSGAGFYVTGSYAGFVNSQGGWDVILGKSNNNPYFRLGNVNAGPSLEYDGTNLNLKNLEIELDTSTVDVHIGENISTQLHSSQDDIMIGSWQIQTSSAPAGSGILVKHGAFDYSEINANGFSRRGFDYPILIYSGYHWGGPIYYTANNGQDSTTTTFPANFFERPFSLDGPYSNSPHRKFPHAIKGCKISHFWGYDKTTVPTGRKLVWNFQRLITNSRNNLVTDKFWNNAIDYDHGRRDTQFVHNSSIDYAGGFWTSNGDAYDHFWHRYNNDYNADGQHHFGYWPDGCSKHVHNDQWCYHGLEFWQSDMELVSSNYHNSSLYMSYGEIEAGTNVSNLYLLSAFNSNSSTSNIRDGIYGGIFTIYETDA